MTIASIRLTSSQVTEIKCAAAEVFCGDVQVWLFGSRVDDRKRGGDIDLFLRPSARGAEQTLYDKVQFLVQLERRLGERKIDVVIEYPDDDRAIVQIAHQTGVRL